ncbi:rRNA biogenesis protein rrp36 [Friedmanniomyces endolithicus]|uniref:rRNA biogenesis protein RRP36 n=1 Tax=Friedmanniomyces endolithicus TaxID=329885 RepID=A0AAN6JYL4_9PEZI|nr:rRNA biogenesis protein rrp36 [Friedmanniomyces endolithicus]KAK0991003.1 rRNA biogenesis protein rrp36 [Friedmanniomyces endolithicus]KAK1029550.1 rRNA biogenesis protein rrp36 [Friedmanniomyces endolithicus]
MAPAKILQRNVRVPKQRHEDEEDAEEGVEYEDMAADDEDAGEGEESGSDMDDEQGRDEEDGDGEDELDGNVEQQVSAISFGALKQAQDAVSRKRKRGSDEAPEQDDKLENLPSPTSRPPPKKPPNGTADKAYSFLLDYQRTEIDDLKAALKRAKGEDDIYNLRRKINSMENRLKAHAAKEREQAVRSAHKKEEKGRVLEGKKPYFLKDKEVKERALVEKFRGMKGKEREKVVEKRRLKESQREKRGMPRDRRRVAQ